LIPDSLLALVIVRHVLKTNALNVILDFNCFTKNVPLLLILQLAMYGQLNGNNVIYHVSHVLPLVPLMIINVLNVQELISL
jgi:hypothetical protein